MSRSTKPSAASAEGHASAAVSWTVLGTLYIVWGTTYLGIAKVNASMPAFVGAAMRFLVAGTLLFAFRLLKTGKRPELRHWKSAAIIGTLLVFGGNAMVATAEETVPTGIVALIIALVPIWLALIDRVVLRGKGSSGRTIVGLLSGFAGPRCWWPAPPRATSASKDC